MSAASISPLAASPPLDATPASRELSKTLFPGSPLIASCHTIRYDTDLAPLIAGLHGNPFQSLPILASWFATFAGRGDARECFLVTLATPDGVPVFALPLVRRRCGGLLRIELPFSGVVDFTTPFVRLGFSALPPPDVLWDLLRPVLPKADIAVLRRMAAGPRPGSNPLFAHSQAQPSRFFTWRVDPLLAREARHARLSKACRKKLRRNREKFLALPGARFMVARSAAEALPLMERLESLQGQRIRAKGLAYGLDCPRVSAFYRRLVAEGVEAGTTLIAGMMLGDVVVGVGYAILSQDEAVYVRVASDFGPHASLTPGLLVSDAAMDEAFARGVRSFDFGMGDYRFKRELGGIANPLRDLIMPLSLAGRPLASAMRIYQRCALNPMLRGLTGRKVLHPVASPPAPQD